MQAILIKSTNPEHKHVHRFYVLIDGGLVSIHRGHSQYATWNFDVNYKETIWGIEPDRIGFIKNNFIMPYLLDNHMITPEDECGMYWIVDNPATKKGCA